MGVWRHYLAFTLSYANPIIMIDQQTLYRLRFYVIALRLIYAVGIIYTFVTCWPLSHIWWASGGIIYSIHVIGYFTISNHYVWSTDSLRMKIPCNCQKRFILLEYFRYQFSLPLVTSCESLDSLFIEFKANPLQQLQPFPLVKSLTAD